MAIFVLDLILDLMFPQATVGRKGPNRAAPDRNTKISTWRHVVCTIPTVWLCLTDAPRALLARDEDFRFRLLTDAVASARRSFIHLSIF